MNNKNFYITTTLPYVNAAPHLGHAMEFVRADVIARFKQKLGYNVFFNTGTDEHGMKVWEGAIKEGLPIDQYVDKYAETFKDLLKMLDVSSEIHFVRTTSEHHIKSVQEFWRRVRDNGYIYKKNYQVRYCVGCEAEKTDSELEDGKCPLHPTREIENIEEENYFFKNSAFTERLLKFYDEHPDFVIPDFRMNEVRGFVKRGLEDFSISRLKSKMSWGIPVPDDEDHVMYVWFDALTNYISTLGWPEDEANFKAFWQDGTPVQYCGKDNNRFQSAMWQAMLMAADLPGSAHIIINGYITGEGGVKMSKSIGNVVSPLEILAEYPADAFRLHMVKEVNLFEDSPFTEAKFKEAYNAHLANGLGNLLSRVMKMATNYGVRLSADDAEAILGAVWGSAAGAGSVDEVDAADRACAAGAAKIDETQINEARTKRIEFLQNFRIDKYVEAVFEDMAGLNLYIQKEEPFKKIKIDEEHKLEAEKDVLYLQKGLLKVAHELEIIMPKACAQIIKCITEHTMPEAPIFIRKD